MHPLLRAKAELRQVINEEIDLYIHGKIKTYRTDPMNGKKFMPKHRYHFFTSTDTRKQFYSGWFRPVGVNLKKKRRKAA